MLVVRRVVGCARRALRRGSRQTAVRGSALAAGVGVCAIVLAGCGGSTASVQNRTSSYGTSLYGALPSAGTPATGGDVSVAQISGQTPDYILPLFDCTHYLTTNINFAQNLYVPLFNGPVGARPEINYQLSAASGPPTASDGGHVYTINLRHDLTWSNGAPVDANDVLFYIDLIKAAIKVSPSDWCGYTPGQFPDDLISATAPDKYTVVLKLSKVFNPGYVLNDQLSFFPIPSTEWNVASADGPHLNPAIPANATKIYDYLYREGQDESAFTTSRLFTDVDGAWTLKNFSLTNGSFELAANPRYSGPARPKLADVSYVTYTGATAELEALRSGALDLGGLDSTQLNQAPALKRSGYSIFGNPSWGFSDAIINFHDATGHWGAVIKQLYARQVMFELEDQPAIIKGIYKGAAVPQYATVPSQPQSPYTPADADKPLYPYSPSRAVATLKANGWKVVPGGRSYCEKPGTSAGECGAGIPQGTGFGGVWLNVPESTAPSAVLSSEDFVSTARADAGLDFTFKTVTFNLAQEYNDQLSSGKSLENGWAINDTGTISASYYPTTEDLYNTGGSQNEGDYSDPQTDKLINASVYSTNAQAVTAEASYLGKSPPVLFFPDADAIGVVSDRLAGTANSFLQLVYQVAEPQYWYIKKSAK